MTGAPAQLRPAGQVILPFITTESSRAPSALSRRSTSSNRAQVNGIPPLHAPRGCGCRHGAGVDIHLELNTSLRMLWLELQLTDSPTPSSLILPGARQTCSVRGRKYRRRRPASAASKFAFAGASFMLSEASMHALNATPRGGGRVSAACCAGGNISCNSPQLATP